MVPSLPPAVRVIPMDSQKEEFPGWTIDDVQRRFFLGDMPWPPNPGRYRYRTHGLQADPGTVVLFRFAAHIVASAVLVRVERYPQPQGPYKGALWFEPASIRVFQPVGADVLRKHWPDSFVKLGNVTQTLDPSNYAGFADELSRVDSPGRCARQAHDLESPPAARVEVTVSRIVRDTQLANRVKAIHNYECQICGYSIILPDGSRYAEGHHVQPLGQPHNGPDVIENIVCLCPNHHAACDLGAMRLDSAALRQAPGHSVGQQFIDYHNETICQTG
jgi:hypothetical protein